MYAQAKSVDPEWALFSISALSLWTLATLT